MLLITVYLIISGIPAIQKIGLVPFLTGKVWSSTSAEPKYGILPFILTSVYGTAGAIVLGVPIGFLTAVYLSKVAPKKVRTVLEAAVSLLAGIPSVVYGLVGMLVLVPAIRKTFHLPDGASLFAAIIVLAVMILPIITSMSRDIFLQTPRLQEEAALALGATKWEMVKLAVLPFGKSGVVSASMLGLGRALGETMAVLMILSPGLNYSVKLLQASQNQTIAANIAAQYPEANDLGVSVLIGTGLVLFLITFVVNFIARKLTEKASV